MAKHFRGRAATAHFPPNRTSSSRWNRFALKNATIHTFTGRSVRYTHIMQLVVQSTGIANWFSALVPPPQRGGCGFAVGARCSRPPGSTLLGLDRERERKKNKKQTGETILITFWSRNKSAQCFVLSEFVQVHAHHRRRRRRRSQDFPNFPIHTAHVPFSGRKTQHLVSSGGFLTENHVKSGMGTRSMKYFSHFQSHSPPNRSCKISCFINFTLFAQIC